MERPGLEEVIIKSTDSSGQLKFSNIEGDHFIASYQSPDLSTAIRVWGYTDCELLVDLFEFMAKEWKGWDGDRSWGSVEDEFNIACTSDKKGHVTMKLMFTQHNSPEPWQVEATLNTEHGVIESNVKDLRKFFYAK